ncbi:MAG: hypothetical protein M1538_00915 [Candidatus Marsarchaeota archaeon]|nr:hypothetical protein [Candidatus Marsarchaeota archaeon]
MLAFIPLLMFINIFWFNIIPTSMIPTIIQTIIIGVIAISSIIIIAAIVYALSGLLNSPNMRAWSRLQVYQALISGALLIFFITILSITYINPNQILTGAGLLPNQCSNINDLYQAATCDMSVFNNDALSYISASGAVALTFAWTPSYNINIPLGNTFAIAFNNVNIVPVEMDDMLPLFFSFMMAIFILNNILLILLAGAVFWFVSFIIIGLLARALGITRSFGGSMIALGVGLGFVLPLLAILMYGFIDMQIGVVNAASITAELMGLIMFFVSYLFAQGAFPFSLGNTLFTLASIVAGLTIIPFLIFTVLDAFIIDFSSAIGERIDFMSMLAGLA